LSVKIDNLLQRKFGKQAVVLNTLPDEAILSQFKTYFAAGDCIPNLWAAASHPGLSSSVKREIFGEIHMGMHWSGKL
jgi:hypothetical protein